MPKSKSFPKQSCRWESSPLRTQSKYREFLTSLRSSTSSIIYKNLLVEYLYISWKENVERKRRILQWGEFAHISRYVRTEDRNQKKNQVWRSHGKVNSIKQPIYYIQKKQISILIWSNSLTSLAKHNGSSYTRPTRSTLLSNLTFGCP